MILKTYLKGNSIVLTDRQQSILGRNVSKCYFSLNPNTTLVKRDIKSNGIKMQVFDYPREFFQSPPFLKVVNRFISKHTK